MSIQDISSVKVPVIRDARTADISAF